MSKRFLVTFGLFVLATAFAVAQAGRTLQVEVTYTGAGTVDANHKIYVTMWDSPDIGGGPPAASQPLTSKKGTVTFSGVQTVPVYITLVYDPSGAWDAQSPPPPGSSMGMYSKNPPKPDPIDIAPGKTTTIQVGLDDSNKVP